MKVKLAKFIDQVENERFFYQSKKCHFWKEQCTLLKYSVPFTYSKVLVTYIVVLSGVLHRFKLSHERINIIVPLTIYTGAKYCKLYNIAKYLNLLPVQFIAWGWLCVNSNKHSVIHPLGHKKEIIKKLLFIDYK